LYWFVPNRNYHGRIADAIVTVGGSGIEKLEPGAYGYFFYAGTAPSPVELSFIMTPKMDENTYYILLLKINHYQFYYIFEEV
jgi:hypothetical protein